MSARPRPCWPFTPKTAPRFWPGRWYLGPSMPSGWTVTSFIWSACGCLTASSARPGLRNWKSGTATGPALPKRLPTVCASRNCRWAECGPIHLPSGQVQNVFSLRITSWSPFRIGNAQESSGKNAPPRPARPVGSTAMMVSALIIGERNFLPLPQGGFLRRRFGKASTRRH